MAEAAKRALVIMAHPDDAEFTAGGTIARLCSQGWDVFYLLTTSGDMGTHDGNTSREKLAALREREQMAAAKVLGVMGCTFLRYPDGFLEDTAEMRGKIVYEIRRIRPDLVITWEPFRRTFTHRDHRITGQAALDAVYPLARSPLAYPEHLEQGLHVHRANEVLLAGAAEPDYYVDVTTFFPTKMAALKKHRSQIGGAPIRELRERLRKRMAETGQQAGYQLAEAFRRLTWT